MMLVLALTSVALAADDFTVTSVEVNDILAGASPVFVEAGSIATVEVTLQGANVISGGSAYDVRVEASVGGYEYGKIEDVTPIFEVEQGVQYRKVLHLNIPEDIEASDDYTLRVDVFDDDNNVQYTFVLRVQEPRHQLRVFDTIINPVKAQAGQPIFVSTRVENLGDNTEEDVKVTVSIPQLPQVLAQSVYIDELITDLSENEDKFNFDEDDAESTNDLMLMLPKDVPTGTYELVVRVDYDRFHTFVEERYVITVTGAAQEKVAVPQLTVQADASSKNVAAGEGVVYTLTFANLGQQAQALTLSVSDVSAWGSAKVEPAVVTVPRDGSAQAFVYVTPQAEAVGTQTFTVVVSDGTAVVQTVALSAVVGPAQEKATGTDLTNVLEIGFIVLLIVLVILGIVIVAKKLGKDDEDLEEPVEGKSYY